MNEKLQQLESRIQELEQRSRVESSKEESQQRTNLADVFSLSPSQTTNDPFWNFMMWGSITLSAGTKTLTDSRIQDTSTVVIGQKTVAATDLVTVTPAIGSCVFGSNGTANFVVYYLIIF